MRRKRTLALAGILMTGAALTGCESCNLFGAKNPLQQDQLAATPTASTSGTPGAAASAGWQGPPKAWTTSPIDPSVKPLTSQGQPASTFNPGMAGQTNFSGTGASNMSSLNSPLPGASTMTSAQGGFSNTTPSAMTAPYGASTRTTNPPAPAPQPDWTLDANTTPQRSLDTGKTSNFQNVGPSPSTQGTNLGAPGSQVPSLSNPGSGASNSQYQTQYVSPGATEVKQMPPPGRGDE